MNHVKAYIQNIQKDLKRPLLSAATKRRMLGFIFLCLVSFPGFISNCAVFAQSEPVTPAKDAQPLGDSPSAGVPGTSASGDTDPSKLIPYSNNPKAQPQSLVEEAAGQNLGYKLQEVNEYLKGMQRGSYNETYLGLQKWLDDDLIGNLFQKIGYLFGKWMVEFLDGWIAPTVHFLSLHLRTFVLNPNIALNAADVANNDGFTYYIRQLADVMYSIAMDLLLLMFVLCVWKMWTEGQNRGAVNYSGTVGRMIATCALMLLWPQLSAYIVQITNEMISAIYNYSATSSMQLEVGMTMAIKSGLVATAGALAHAVAPVVPFVGGAAVTTPVWNTIGSAASFVGVLIYTIFGMILIVELLSFIVLKAIQTGLVVAQYVFAPVFLVCFALPDAEMFCVAFVRACVEVNLWSFIWVGLLRILVILVTSDFNPWGKILTAIGILQIMLMTPMFLKAAQISPVSSFIDPGNIGGGILKGLRSFGESAAGIMDKVLDKDMNGKYNPANSRAHLSVAAPPLVTSGANASGSVSANLGGNATSSTSASANTAAPGLGQSLAGLSPNANKNPNDPIGQAVANALGTTNGPPLQQNGLPGLKPGVNVPGLGLGLAGASGIKLANSIPLSTGINNAMQQFQKGAAAADPLASNVPADLQGATPNIDTANADADGDAAGTAGTASLPGTSTAAGKPYNPMDKYGPKILPNTVSETVGKIKERKIQLAHSPDGQLRFGSLTNKDGSVVDQIYIPKGYNERQTAEAIALCSLARAYEGDSEADETLTQSAIAAGGLQARPGSEGAFATVKGSKAWEETGRTTQRMKETKFAQAVQGASEYMNGAPNNNYAKFLQSRYGNYSQAIGNTVELLLDAEDPSSPWHPASEQATKALGEVGESWSPVGMGIMCNETVRNMPRGQRTQGFQSMKQYAVVQSQRTGLALDSSDMTKHLARMAPANIHALMAMGRSSGGLDVEIISEIAELGASSGRGPQSYDNALSNFRTVHDHLGGHVQGGEVNVRQAAARVTGELQGANKLTPQYVTNEVLIRGLHDAITNHDLGVVQAKAGYEANLLSGISLGPAPAPVQIDLETHAQLLGGMPSQSYTTSGISSTQVQMSGIAPQPQVDIVGGVSPKVPLGGMTQPQGTPQVQAFRAQKFDVNAYIAQYMMNQGKKNQNRNQ